MGVWSQAVKVALPRVDLDSVEHSAENKSVQITFSCCLRGLPENGKREVEALIFYANHVSEDALSLVVNRYLKGETDDGSTTE